MSEVVVPAAGFVFAGTYAEDDPAAGLETHLRLLTYVEELGFDVVGVRQRHLERGISSALPFLAAASQRTRRIALETDVVPLGYETPFRLAEDFATVDALSRGRVNVGISTSAPHADLLGDLGRVHGAGEDPYELIRRFLLALEGHALQGEELPTPYGPQIPRVQPHVAGLRDRVWLGGGSLRSVRWAAAHGLKLLLGNIADADGDARFEQAQHVQVSTYHDEFQGDAPAVGVERVILPKDSATAAQREHYAAYVAARDPRTAEPAQLGDRRIVFQRDLHGTAAQIAERLAADPTFDGRTELRVALPYGFAEDEYRQIVADVRHALLPLVGWQPARLAA